MAAFHTERERHALILNRKESLRLDRLLDHLEYSKRLEDRSMGQLTQVFRIRRHNRLQVLSSAANASSHSISKLEKLTPETNGAANDGG